MNRIFLTTLAIFALSASVACQKQKQAIEEPEPTPTDTPVPPTVASNQSDLPLLGPAPEWSLPRLDGSQLTSEDLAGKIVVVDFWATWCPPCRAEIPGYIAMQDALRDEGVVVLGISLDEGGPSVVEPFAERFGINYELVMGDRSITDAFGGVRVIPTTFLIDRDGQVRHRKEGMMEREDYEPLVRSLL